MDTDQTKFVWSTSVVSLLYIITKQRRSSLFVSPDGVLFLLLLGVDFGRFLKINVRFLLLW